jgi:hypothetical protein
MKEKLIKMAIGELLHFSGDEMLLAKPLAHKLKMETHLNFEIFKGKLNDVEGIFVRRLRDYTPQK